MDDSFNQLARSIRQNKINKREIRKIKKEVVEINMKKTQKSKMAIYIQKIIRGYLYRKRFLKLLDKVNIETIIDYFYDKKITRIHEHNTEIISFFILKYLNKERKKISIMKKKEESINLIKAHLRGIISRKRFKAKINAIRRCKKKILKYILSYKIKLILRCKEIQNILSDIAEIKFSLKNIDKQNDINGYSQNIKDLKNKLNKSINSFYITFYNLKENIKWVNQEKTENSWISKYMYIIQKDVKNNINNHDHNNSKNQMVYINSNKQSNYSISKTNKSIGQTQYLQIKIKPKKYLGIDDREKISEKEKNGLDEKNIIENNHNINNEKIDILKFNEEENSTKNINNDQEDKNKIKVSKNKRSGFCSKIRRNDNNKINIQNDSNNFLLTDSVNEMNINNDILQNLNDNDKIEIFNSSKNIFKNKLNNERLPKFNRNNYVFEDKENLEINENNINTSKSTQIDLNKFSQRDERPIQPLNSNNFLNTKNPFGARGNKLYSSGKENNIIKNTKTFKESLPSKDLNKIPISKKNKNSDPNLLDINNDTENKYNQYDNRPCGGNKINYNDVFGENKKKNNEERPIGSGKNFNYDEMFKNENFEYEGDPFGGAKQFESKNKKIIHNNKNNENVKKKPVYDARKAIEEAKLKEAKEGKKEKPSAFREFLKEMRKINAEEKNEKIDDKNKNEKNNKNNKIEDNNKKENIDIDNKKITSNKNVTKKNNKNIQNEKNKENTENENDINDIVNNDDKKINKNKAGAKFKKEPEAKEITLRKKLHELEKAPAPMLNIKGVKSRIECWGGDNKKSRVSPSNLRDKDIDKQNPNNMNSNYNKNKILNDKKENNEVGNNKKQKQLNKNEINDTKIDPKDINEFLNNRKQRKLNSNNNINKANNKVFEEKIEKYVDKKLMQLNIQIEEIDDIFNLEEYFKEKEIKMKKFYSIPFIKEEFISVKNYTNDVYENLISEIESQYKILK